MKEPTEAQKIALWEWCGFEFVSKDDDFIGDPDFGSKYWLYPDKPMAFALPSITLDNLFKYAVTKLIAEKWEVEISISDHGTSVYLTHYNDKMEVDMGYPSQGKDPALALFWACDAVREESK